MTFHVSYLGFYQLGALIEAGSAEEAATIAANGGCDELGSADDGDMLYVKGDAEKRTFACEAIHRIRVTEVAP